MNTQRAFDVASRHLLTQLERSFDKLGRPMLRGEAGMMDAIGCLIDQRFYSPELEHVGISYLFGLVLNHKDQTGNIRKALDPIYNGVSLGFLKDLQAIHDHYVPKLWKTKLYWLGVDWGLNTSVLDEFSGEVKEPPACRIQYNLDKEIKSCGYRK